MNNSDIISNFCSIVGHRNVITGRSKTKRFRTGFRSGYGDAMAVVLPRTLLELWYVVKASVEADKVVIMQAANTGLTAGSTPWGNYNRDVILINTQHMNDIHVIDHGRQVVSFPGATLFALETLLKPLKRQPHSVIGSSCIGASIVGGISNNSGGSLVERGPAYTELSLYAQVNAEGKLELVNNLDISLGTTPEEILSRLQGEDFTTADIGFSNKQASDTKYAARVRDVDALTPARFNADTRRLFQASGCAGKLVVFAVRVDTFPQHDSEQVFYIGTNNPAELTDLRRHILQNFAVLPESAEYMHRNIFDIARDYGKDTVLLIHYLGTKRLPAFFALKGAIDARINSISFLPKNLIDRVLQRIAKVWPNVLPERMDLWRDKFEHHLILKMRDTGIKEAEEHLKQFFQNRTGDYFTCTSDEAHKAFLHRFSAAGAAVRYQAIHERDVEDIVALDIALKRNERRWLEDLPKDLEKQILHKLYYGHFLCHVLHQDYIVKKGTDVAAFKATILALLDQRGAQYPAEHNVGNLYKANPEHAQFYKTLDPTNRLNPGIGGMSKNKDYA